MPRSAPIQSDFTAGELSPLMYARVDAQKYKTGLAVCQNYLPLIQGGLTRRPGSNFAGEVKFSQHPTRIQAFEFSVSEAYMLEFGNLYVRIYKNGDVVTNAPVTISGISTANPCVVTANSHGFANGNRILMSGIVGMPQLNNKEFIVQNVTTNTFTLQDAQSAATINSTTYGTYVSGGQASQIFEVTTPYGYGDVFNLKFTQSEDVLYICHPNYPPATLNRFSDSDWTYTAIVFEDGPYLPIGQDVPLGSSAATVSITTTGFGFTVTFNSAVGINQGNGFTSTDIGRLVRILSSTGVWSWLEITSIINSTSVGCNGTGSVNASLTDYSSVATWQLGLYSATTGYPTCCTFHEQRLVFAGCNAAPQRIDGSVVANFTAFYPTEIDGSVTSSDAYAFSMDSNDVNQMIWLATDAQGLLSGTAGGEWFVEPGGSNGGITPTNVNALQNTDWGSANIDSVKVGRTHLHVQRGGRKLRELSYDFYINGFDSQDMTLLSEHITGQGIIQLARQAIPQSIIWAVRMDGTLLSMTYERDGQQVKAGWARHVLGGASDAAGTQAIVESVAAIPSSDQTFDQLYVVVRRWVNGASHRYIEYLSKIFESFDDQPHAVFLDSNSTYDNAITVSAISQANPCTVTAANHGFSNGMQVRFEDIVGMTELNDNTYTVSNVTTNTFQLSGINSLTFFPYVSGGVVREVISSISGLNYLEGQTVSLLADGAVLPQVTVTAGTITLPNPSTIVQIGLPYNSDGQQLRIDAGSADGTSLGKTRRINRVGFMFERTLGFMFGSDFSSLDEITFRTSQDPATRAPQLFSGIKSELIEMNYDFENQICWRQNEPLPGTIVGIFPQMDTQDRN